MRSGAAKPTAGTRLGRTVEGESVGDYLKVDVALLRATGAGLGQIKDILQHAQASSPGYQVLGSHELSEVMDDFVSNWEIHRGKLVSAVEAHQQMALQSADAYEHTDSELARALTQHSSPGEARVTS
ncbi:MAG: hypothetical protein JO115_19990 [Pseudonocardiales bacterium]|nr:hypothetical protein [Pseudonocardiales bacterium]